MRVEFFSRSNKTQEMIKPPHSKGLGGSCLDVVTNHQNPMYASHLEFCIPSHLFRGHCFVVQNFPCVTK